MKKANLLILFLLVLLGLLGVIIYQQDRTIQQEQITTLAPATKQQPIKQPIIHYPVPEPAATLIETAQNETDSDKASAATPPLPETLPPVQQSDDTIKDILAKLVSDTKLFELLNLDNFIQRFVVVVDSLPGKRLPRTHLPVQPPTGRFIVSGTETAPQTSSRNHKRYQKYVDLLEMVDPKLAVNVYTHLYPLFQKAYELLGYNNAYFNDRLIFTLDHLLETPEPKEPILLEQPSILYIYADPLLENCSAGQKILIRIGPQHRAKVKKILTVYRELLTNLHP